VARFCDYSLKQPAPIDDEWLIGIQKKMPVGIDSENPQNKTGTYPKLMGNS
jgi:hypothetical protein